MRAEEGLHLNDDGCTEKHPPLTAKQFNLRWQHYCREPLAFYFPTSSGHHFTCWVMTKHLQSQVSGLFNLCATFQRLHLQIACSANSKVQQNVWLGLGKWQWERWLLQSRESRGGTVFTLFFPTHFQEQVHLAGTFLPLTRAYLSTQTTVRGSASLAVLLILSQCSLECIAWCRPKSDTQQFI